MENSEFEREYENIEAATEELDDLYAAYARLEKLQAKQAAAVDESE